MTPLLIGHLTTSSTSKVSHVLDLDFNRGDLLSDTGIDRPCGQRQDPEPPPMHDHNTLGVKRFWFSTVGSNR